VYLPQTLVGWLCSHLAVRMVDGRYASSTQVCLLHGFFQCTHVALHNGHAEPDSAIRHLSVRVQLTDTP